MKRLKLRLLEFVPISGRMNSFLTEQKKGEPEAMRILDQLDAWVIKTGITEL